MMFAFCFPSAFTGIAIRLIMDTVSVMSEPRENWTNDWVKSAQCVLGASKGNVAEVRERILWLAELQVQVPLPTTPAN